MIRSIRRVSSITTFPRCIIMQRISRPSYRLYSSCGRMSEGGKNFIYGGVLLGTATLFGGLLYLVGKDLLFPGGTYDVVDKAVQKIEANPQLVQMLGGLPLKVYGHTGHRSRRRPAVHQSMMPDGARCLEASFFVEGPSGTHGQVSLQLVESASDGGAEWKERYFAVEVEGFPPHILVQPPPSVVKHQSRQGWHPFNRLFSS